MNKFFLSFILTFFAGFSTLVGFFVIYFDFLKKEKLISNCLAFSAGVMICVSVIDLIPESFNLLRYGYNSFFVIFVCSLFLILGSY